MSRARAAVLAAAVASGLAGAGPLRAQSPDEARIPWTFAPLLGTGRYEIAEDTTVQSISYAPRRRFGAAELSDDGSRRLGLELRVPLSVSTYRTGLSDLSSLSLDDVGTFAAVPGVEVDVPVSPRFRVKPVAYAGLGKEFHGGPRAWIYWAGFKTRTSLRARGPSLSFVTSLRYAGFNASDGDSGDVVPIRAGIEITQPMRGRTIGGDALDWHWHVARTHYLDDDASPASAPTPFRVDDEWELGIAFGKRDGRLTLGRLGWDRVGFALTLDPGGDLSGFRLVFKSLYDR